MGIFDIFKKRGLQQTETPLKKRLRDFKCRRICYVDTDFKELVARVAADPAAVLSLEPVNYYAVKNQYIMAHVYSSEDCSENYVKFQRFDYERKTDESSLLPLDRATLTKALAKVGIIIT
ncbi:hypothetical protein [Ruminococcus sp. Marseille-P6503]|uniref:hypothetical protein n=1 Tax=Ruminococcus sp. Marseille-P6503 TaxID=2364796 RepID=UPI000F54B6BA|nr:hypothetical protein [Ruminococcus sp. Marseille-P6503]